MTITIDGPAAAGKTTLAKAISDRWGFTRLDSGALYRALALHFLEHPDTDDVPRLDFAPGGHVLVDGADREADIRTPRISMAASELSKQPGVRNIVDAVLRATALLHPDTVAEGRDMGTTVFPDADLKVFLTAPLRTRAERRRRQIPLYTFDDILNDLAERDRNDTEREASPLRMPGGAVVIDNRDFSVEETLAIIASHIRTFFSRKA